MRGDARTLSRRSSPSTSVRTARDFGDVAKARGAHECRDAPPARTSAASRFRAPRPVAACRAGAHSDFRARTSRASAHHVVSERSAICVPSASLTVRTSTSGAPSRCATPAGMRQSTTRMPGSTRCARNALERAARRGRIGDRAERAARHERAAVAERQVHLRRCPGGRAGGRAPAPRASPRSARASPRTDPRRASCRRARPAARAGGRSRT